MSVKNKLTLLQNCSNVVSMTQAEVNEYKLDDDKYDQFFDGVKLFSKKAKNHLSFKYVDYHIKNNFKYLDLVSIPKYPLLAVYNTQTRKCLINLSATSKTRPENLDSRDLYTMIAYGHCVSMLTTNEIDSKHADAFCEYLSLLLLKIYAKPYGITGSYVDLIPQFKFIVSLYVYVSFFNIPYGDAVKRASALMVFDHRKLGSDFLSKYTMKDPEDLLKMLSDSATCSGLNTYKFVSKMIQYFGVMNLSMFEDLMRFCGVMFGCTINSNSFFNPIFQVAYSQPKFAKINTIIEHYLS